MQHADLVKSASDPHTYLIHDTADPLQASLSGLLLEGLAPAASASFAPRAGGGAPLSPASAAPRWIEDACAGDAYTYMICAVIMRTVGTVQRAC